jgi:hypothetical protein
MLSMIPNDVISLYCIISSILQSVLIGLNLHIYTTCASNYTNSVNSNICILPPTMDDGTAKAFMQTNTIFIGFLIHIIFTRMSAKVYAIGSKI